ncbi:MAG: hypothetical protein ACRDDY_13905 [Clostridium sp.]|uniref:hypothetical protein n=1 Tax=Clostridium sp. TaxID=1506 RepID=UPI003EE7D5E9
MRLSKLENFLRQTLLTYKGIEACLDKLVDGTSDEHLAFHKLSTEAHVGFFEFTIKKNTYWLRRVSNIRNTAGYDSYQYQLTNINPQGEEDDVNIRFRMFTDVWTEEYTVNMNVGSIKK